MPRFLLFGFLIYRRFGYVETGTEEFIRARPLKDGLGCHCIVMSKKL
jgi:hypothetical protein